ncbi:NAD-dependent epimerase/dehydratase family protein [Candidatus Neptunochlamydia vexilliferae]|uniref:NAD-dependent epimerase/dehydratase domain-containing protein n=1 Tax=Candidatus Neptunichlamydia vexilliferae TaxID=1651774 RepID=A0ABS0AZS9_9BACT|nr:NAD(P)-dependent oxidoreductase [Candidatus Neptunochlamydia vexilliferae]MBF5059642.1 hypothetical protein [Candidatus Neptunochlamydia vexilliferae]
MRILITGSKGLIGTALKNSLRFMGLEVVGIDNEFDPHHPEHGDILDSSSLFSKVKGIDGIVHLAAISRVIFGEKNPELCWKTNVEGTRNIIEAALSTPRKPWMIYASSREVYGEQETLPVPESATLRPVNIYGESKVEAEKIVEQAKKKGLKGTIVRFSNVYGSVLDHHNRVIPAFCRAAATGHDIIVEGKDNLFDFTYLEDVIQGVLSLINLLSTQDAPPPIHFTTGKTSSLGEVAEIAKEASLKPLNILEGTPRSFDVSRFRGETSRAKKLLNWRACVDIKEGMQRLIHQYSLYLNANLAEPVLAY